MTNSCLFIFNSIVTSIASFAVVVFAQQHLSISGFSQLPNTWVKALLAFIGLDLVLYLWHRACHHFDCLWMFHRVHHNEPFLNISTAFRVHVLEVLITNLLKAGYVISIGLDQMQILVNEALLTCFIMLHHSNISFKGEKWLGWLVITPAIHRSHHSVERLEHDSNYGSVLSLWDRLFRTLNLKHADKLGIQQASPKDFARLLSFGFSFDSPKPAPAINLETMIAEAAYYKAEQRNFRPGHELKDWLDAQRDIMKLLYEQK
ncbi:sterol desaturase family protein [Methylocucumis oryzae]|uniref:sterol desaturase family protein n=1 Tax=Methylocucumis oryzae TaxID=1632867 RepID=UPI0006978C35|nr:sterol desaturase family protein [Methylocucumis oryzae]